jgi:hypothetical protein
VGNNTICNATTCPPPNPTGACCLKDGHCIQTNPVMCDQLDGIFGGANSACPPNLCYAPCCIGHLANANSAGAVDLADLSAMVSYLTGGGYVFPCPDAANVNNAGAVDLADLSAMVSYLTGGGFALPPCP